MTPPEPSLFAVIVEYASALGSPVAALGIWLFGIVMLFQNRSRAKADRRRADVERNRHTEAMTALAQAAEDRKDAQAAAAESQKVTNGLLAALERQGAALEKLIDRTDAVVVELQRHQGPGTRPRRRA